jgi:hypothetical protein
LGGVFSIRRKTSSRFGLAGGSAMVDPQTLKPNQLYCNLMDEVQARLQLMENVLNKKYPMHPMLAEELCYFQLRMLCETFACALLVAHGSLTGFSGHRLKGEWSANTIIKEVQKLYEATAHQPTELGTGSFYPIPYRIVSVTPAHGVQTEMRKNVDILSASEFIQLYGMTHSRTHRGALSDFRKRAPYVNVDFQPIIQWTTKLANLLVAGHLIQSPDRRKSWIVTIRPPEQGGPFCVETTSPPPPTQSQ